jgi:hypothetical protein
MENKKNQEDWMRILRKAKKGNRVQGRDKRENER